MYNNQLKSKSVKSTKRSLQGFLMEVTNKLHFLMYWNPKSSIKRIHKTIEIFNPASIKLKLTSEVSKSLHLSETQFSNLWNEEAELDKFYDPSSQIRET